jgi:hypothetical protein
MDENKVVLFIDDDDVPFAELASPAAFDLDTTKLADGEHILTIVAKSHRPHEGIKKIPFVVRNGPSINVVGLKEGEKVDGVISLMINSYAHSERHVFTVHGSETPRRVPGWVWGAVALFAGWSAYYFLDSFSL